MTVIEADGIEVEPYTADNLQIFAGELLTLSNMYPNNYDELNRSTLLSHRDCGQTRQQC